MSGLCVAALESSRNVEPILETMLARMRHYPWLRADGRRVSSGQVGLGEVTLEPLAAGAFATSSDGQCIAVLHGEIFNDAVERQRIGRASVEGDSDSAFLLGGWIAEGAPFLARLNGEFAAAIWDGRSGTLHVITDRFGLRPVYVARPAGGFAAASEIKAVLAVPGVDTSWSEDGVAGFFGFGYFFGDHTLLAGVRALPPATCASYRIADGHFDEAIYWHMRPGAVRGTPDELSAALDDGLVRAVERRARKGEALGLSLSGGLDARTLLALVPNGVSVRTVSLGIEGSLDHRSAAALAALAGVPHHQYLLDASFLGAFETHLRQMVWLTDGHYLDQGIVMPTMDVYRQLGIEYLLRGHGGELFHMTKAYAFSLDAAAVGASAPALRSWLQSHLTGYMLGGVPPDLFTTDLRAGTSSLLDAAIARCHPTDRPVDTVWQLFLNERIHRETSLSMHTFGYFATVRQPYFDNDVVDLILSLPAEIKLGDELQTRVLRHRRPAFLGVTNSNTGTKLGAGRLATEIARFRLRVGAKLGLKGYQPYERLGLWLKRELRGLVQSTLSDEAFLGCGLFRPDAVKRVVAQHLDGQANHTFLIMSLMIFALGLDVRENTERFRDRTR